MNTNTEEALKKKKTKEFLKFIPMLSIYVY